MTIRTKYVNEMNGIKADEEFKNTIISQVISSTDGSLTVARKLRSKVAMVVASCLVVFLLAIGTQLIFHKGDKDSSGLYKRLVITAYAADGAPILVSPDVDFPLGQYSMNMSSVPGIPITITCKDADKISLRTSEGTLLLWNPWGGSRVIPLGQETTVKSGITIYWNPVAESDLSKVAIESLIDLSAYKDKKKLGSSTIEIKSQDRITYKGKLTYN